MTAAQPPHEDSIATPSKMPAHAIERAAEAREPELVLLGVRPVYAVLREHPRVVAVRARVGI